MISSAFEFFLDWIKDIWMMLTRVGHKMEKIEKAEENLQPGIEREISISTLISYVCVVYCQFRGLYILPN